MANPAMLYTGFTALTTYVNPKIKNVVIRAVGAPVDFYYADLSE